MGRLDYIYRWRCSCCSATIVAKEFEEEVIPNDNRESEGNLCAKHYYEEQRQDHYEKQKMINLVAGSISNPLHRFGFNHQTFEEKLYDCQKLLEMGAISFNIR